jgi:hypothetical protein
MTHANGSQNIQADLRSAGEARASRATHWTQRIRNHPGRTRGEVGRGRSGAECFDGSRSDHAARDQNVSGRIRQTSRGLPRADWGPLHRVESSGARETGHATGVAEGSQAYTQPIENSSLNNFVPTFPTCQLRMFRSGKHSCNQEKT